MATWDFIIGLFCEVDEQLRAMPKHPEAHLWPSEVGTLGLLHALKGVGNRALYRPRMSECVMSGKLAILPSEVESLTQVCGTPLRTL